MYINYMYINQILIRSSYNMCELPPLIPTGLKWGLPIEFPLKANPAVPAVLFCSLLFRFWLLLSLVLLVIY